MAAVKLRDFNATNVAELSVSPKAIVSHDTIGVAADLDPASVIELVSATGIRHVVQKNGLVYADEMKTAESMIRDPAKYLDHPFETIFGGEANARKKFSIICSATEKKTLALTKFGDFVAELPGSRTIWDKALLIGDELYTNASKNAWNPGPLLFTGPPARQGTIEFMAEADQNRLIICCRDSFGKFVVDGVVARIATCFRNGISQSIRHDTAGAGIGSHMVFDACVSYYAGSEIDRRSVVCVSLPLGLNRRSASGLCKNIHLLP